MVQHAGPSRFGPFSPDQADELVRTLRKNIGPNTRSVNLLGCQVDRGFATEVDRLLSLAGDNTWVSVLTDAPLPDWVRGQEQYRLWIDGDSFFVMELNTQQMSGWLPIANMNEYLRHPSQLHRNLFLAKVEIN